MFESLLPYLLSAFLALTTYYLFNYLINWYRANQLLPPGPWGRPIFGVLQSIKKEFHLFIHDLTKVYGKIVSFKMGQETIVVLSDPKVIKEAFKKKEFSYRPKSELSNLLNGYGKCE